MPNKENTCTDHKTDGKFCPNCGSETVGMGTDPLKELLKLLRPILGIGDDISISENAAKIIDESGLIEAGDFYFIDRNFYKTGIIIRYSDIKKTNYDFWEFVDLETLRGIIKIYDGSCSKDRYWSLPLSNVCLTDCLSKDSTESSSKDFGIPFIKIFNTSIKPTLDNMLMSELPIDIKTKVYASVKNYYMSTI